LLGISDVSILASQPTTIVRFIQFVQTSVHKYVFFFTSVAPKDFMAEDTLTFVFIVAAFGLLLQRRQT